MRRIRALLFGLSLLACASAWPSLTAGAPEEPGDYRHRTIYFIVADRFHASQPFNPYVDPEHPDATNTRNCFEEACPLEEQWRRYWGGDIRGIIQKLDYLERLGVSGLWVTPLMANVRAYEPSRVFHAWGAAYHGYWVENYDRVSPHFGTWDDVGQLAQALRARGIRYIQDITLNHSNPLDTHAHGRLPYRTVHADDDLLVFERRSAAGGVLVAVNRGAARVVDLEHLAIPPGPHQSLIAHTSDLNAATLLVVAPGGAATLTMGPLSAFVLPYGDP